MNMTNPDNPELSQGTGVTPPPGNEAKISSKAAEYVELPRTFELTPETALVITTASPTRLLVVAGQEKSGKTTLVASIYERLLRQPSFAGYSFAGSETLRGFEQRCHLARAASGLLRPDTERTRRSEKVALLHLRIRRQNLGRPCRDLLFTDIFGEVFREAKDSTESCRKLEFLRRADRVLLLIDGADLAEEGRRNAAFAAGRDFLRRSSDAEMLGSGSLVDIMFTKWDMIVSLPEPEKQRAEQYVERIETWFREDLMQRFASVRFARVAARPDPPSALAPAHGLDIVFPAWVEESARYNPSVTRLEVPMLEREIDRYIIRRGADVAHFL